MKIAPYRLFPGEASSCLTPVARLDHALATGKLPQRMDAQELGLNDEFTLQMAPENGAICDTYEPDRSDSGMKHQRFHHMTGIAVACSWGLAMGALATSPLGLVGGVAVGAAVGLVKAYQNMKMVHEHGTGKVLIENDGRRSESSFVWSPNEFKMNPQDWRGYLHAVGALGDSTQPHNVSRSTSSSTEIPEEKNPVHLDTKAEKQLAELSRQRRLVADAGLKSRYGHDLLSQIDSSTATVLLDKGVPVYIVNGQEVNDQPHYFESNSRSHNGKQIGRTRIDYVERNFQYGLSRISSDKDVAEAEDHIGIPSGIQAVYTHGDEISEYTEMKGSRSFDIESFTKKSVKWKAKGIFQKLTT